MLNGDCDLQIKKIKNYQGVGSSDHCPLVITLAMKRDTQEKATVDPILRNLVTHPDGTNAPIIIDESTGRQKAFEIYESPVIYINIAGKEEPAFIDSGAPFSIFNPPMFDGGKDRIYGQAQALRSNINCKFGGVGGGKIVADGNYLLDVSVGGTTRSCRFVFLRGHEPSLPRFLLGMDVITGALQGVRIKRTPVQFEIAPEVIFPARINPNSKLSKALDEQVVSLIDAKQDQDRVESYFEAIAEARYKDENRCAYPAQDVHSREFTDEREFEEEQKLLQEKFHDTPMPMIQMHTSTSDSKLKALVDSGSTFSLISNEAAKILLKKGDAMEDKSQKAMPNIRIADGEMVTAKKKVLLKLSFDRHEHVVPFYVFDGLPLDAIIGNDVCKEWKSILSWDDHTWSISTTEGSRISIPWVSVYGKYWRGPENLIAKDDCIIPPQSHSKIKLQSAALSKLELQGVKDDFAFISSIQDQRVRTFKTAYGTSSLTPEWVQLANPTDDPIFIKKGEVVAHLHPREQPQVDDAPELDVTADDLKKEKDILIATIAAKQKMEGDRDAFLHDSYVRLVIAGDDLQGRPITHHLKPTWCTCCE